MAQNTVNYANNPTGPELLDNYLAKEQENILSSNSGIQRPSYAIAGTSWIDTSVTPWLYKIYDGSEDVIIGAVNSSTHGFVPSGVDESNLVHKSETETITGSKIFSSSPIVPTATSGDSSTKAASTAFVANIASGLQSSINNAVVHLTGSETIAGIKTFSNETIFNGTHNGNGANFRAISQNEKYGMIFRCDGSNNFYIFPTAENDPFGSWDSIYKGIAIGCADGVVSLTGQYGKGYAVADLAHELTQNGYIKLSTGLTIQWMLTPDIYNYGTTITFPTPFTTTNYAICFNPFRSNPFNENATTVTERTTSTCKVYGKTYDGGSMSCPCFAIAIGY